VSTKIVPRERGESGDGMELFYAGTRNGAFVGWTEPPGKGKRQAADNL